MDKRPKIGGRASRNCLRLKDGNELLKIADKIGHVTERERDGLITEFPRGFLIFMVSLIIECLSPIIYEDNFNPYLF